MSDGIPTIVMTHDADGDDIKAFVPPVRRKSQALLPAQTTPIHPALVVLNELLYLPECSALLQALDSSPLVAEWIDTNKQKRHAMPAWASSANSNSGGSSPLLGADGVIGVVLESAASVEAAAVSPTPPPRNQETSEDEKKQPEQPGEEGDETKHLQEIQKLSFLVLRFIRLLFPPPAPPHVGDDLLSKSTRETMNKFSFTAVTSVAGVEESNAPPAGAGSGALATSGYDNIATTTSNNYIGGGYDASDAALLDEALDGSSVEEQQAAMINDLHAAIKKMQQEHEAERQCDRVLHEGRMRQASVAAYSDALSTDVSLQRIGSSMMSGNQATESDVLELVKQRNAQKAAMEHAQRDAALLNDQLAHATAKAEELEKTVETLEVAFMAMQSIHENIKSTSDVALVTAAMQAEGKLTEVHRKLALQSSFLFSTTTAIHSLEQSHQREVAKLSELHAKTLLDVTTHKEQLLRDRAGLLHDIESLRKERNVLSLLVSESAEKAVRQSSLFLDSMNVPKCTRVVRAAACSGRNEADAPPKEVPSRTARSDSGVDTSAGMAAPSPPPPPGSASIRFSPNPSFASGSRFGASASPSLRASVASPMPPRKVLALLASSVERPRSASFLAKEIAKVPIMAFQTQKARMAAASAAAKGLSPKPPLSAPR